MVNFFVTFDPLKLEKYTVLLKSAGGVADKQWQPQQIPSYSEFV